MTNTELIDGLLTLSEKFTVNDIEAALPELRDKVKAINEHQSKVKSLELKIESAIENSGLDVFRCVYNNETKKATILA